MKRIEIKNTNNITHEEAYSSYCECLLKRIDLQQAQTIFASMASNMPARIAGGVAW